MTTAAPDEFDPFGPVGSPVVSAAGAPLPPAVPVRQVAAPESVAPAVAAGDGSPSSRRLAEGEVTAPLGGVVAGGSRKPFPAARPLPEWPGTDVQDVRDAVDATPDYSDLAALNRDLLRLRVRMAQVRRAMREASRAAVELRRALVQQSGGSAEMRKAAAELMCEDLEARAIIAEKSAEEFVTLYRSVRDDMENAKVVAYNLRVLHSMD